MAAAARSQSCILPPAITGMLTAFFAAAARGIMKPWGLYIGGQA